jgi:hypothetical protein
MTWRVLRLFFVVTWLPLLTAFVTQPRMSRQITMNINHNIRLAWSHHHRLAKRIDEEEEEDEDDVLVEYQDFLPNPHPSLTAVDVVRACMDTLRQRKDTGLEVCFQFSSDRCRAANGGSLDAFVSYAQNPTFGYLLNCVDYRIESIGPIIPGTMHRGSMQTVLMLAKQRKISSSSDDDDDDDENASQNDEKRSRRFLWTLQQERRPPLQGCWMIHEVLFTKNAIHQTL